MGAEESQEPTTQETVERQEEQKTISYSSKDKQDFFASKFPVHVSDPVFHLREELIKFRRYFHSRPELSREEKNTSSQIARLLTQMNLEVTPNVAGTGVVGLLKGDKPGPCILLRADMDGLPITEKADLPFKSQNEGVMHACGHDCHMSMLLGAARVLSSLRHHLHGSIKFVFQPAEEIVWGAKQMIAEGVLENPHVDEVYGIHVFSYQKFGSVVCRSGPLMAGTCKFAMNIRGVGGHGAVPQGTRDAVVAVSNLVVQLHTIVGRNLPPLESGVLTVGKVQSGTKGNVIAEEASIEGTIRWFDPKIYDIIIDRIQAICEGIERSFGVEIETIFSQKTPCTVNDEECTEKVASVASQVLPEGVTASKPTMAAEDFSYFLEARPGCFFFIGCGVDEDAIYAHHKPNFQVDERCLPVGCEIFVQLALDLLSKPVVKVPQTVEKVEKVETVETVETVEDAPVGNGAPAPSQTQKQ